jgi:hypothetical protein
LSTVSLWKSPSMRMGFSHGMNEFPLLRKPFSYTRITPECMDAASN